jgi:carbonic anhydrase
MKKKLLLSILVGLATSSVSQASHQSHWSYTGNAGPKHWGELSPDYTLCSSGKNQSPVNLTGMIEGDLPPLIVNYKKGGFEIVNNGHSIQVNYAPGSTITIGDHRYELKQFHFHTPSENTIEGRSFPMEAHLVHADSQGNLAVIAIMYDTGKANPELQKAWRWMPQKVGVKKTLPDQLDANALMSGNLDYDRFNGSLTTPPCSEGVVWIVMKAPGTVSQAQVKSFAKTMHHDNNRPLQRLNGRIVVK